MRIAFYAPMKPPDHAVPSGDRRVARLLMRALRQAGHRVDLASRLRAWDGAGDADHQARVRGRAARIVEGLTRRWEREGPPDLWFTYHLYHKAPDWIGPAMAREWGLPYAVAEASVSARQADGPWAEGYAQALAALRQAGAIFAMTQKDRTGLVEALGANAPIHSLHPFLEAGAFARAARQGAEARRRWVPDLPCDEPVILAVGMMRRGDKEASFRVLAKALSRLSDRRWTLLLVGYGPMQDEVRSWFPVDRTRAIGQVRLGDMPSLYVAADLVAWPAINEAFGMALLEAQAAGTPVVAGHTGGVPDIVGDGRTGRLVAPGDAAAFADAIGELLDDRGLRVSMGVAALANVAAHHSMEAAVAVLDPALKRLAG